MKVVCLAITLLTLPLAASPKMHGPTSHNKEVQVEGPTVRVLLGSGINSALLEAKGPYRVVRCDRGTFLSGGLVGKRYVVHSMQNGLRWGEEFPQTTALSVIPSSPQTQFFVNGFQYRGAITVLSDSKGQLTIINEAPIEDFVKSVIAVKYQRAMSKEAAAALAIVERTRIFSKVLEAGRNDRPWDVTAKECSYCGYGVTHNRNGIDAAVDYTPFMIVQSRSGKESLTDLRLSLPKAVELAQLGFDAKRILSECFPQAVLGLTADVDQFAVR